MHTKPKKDYSCFVHGLDPKEVEKDMDREIDSLDHFREYVWVLLTLISKGAQIHATDWYMKLTKDGRVRRRLDVQQVMRERHIGLFSLTTTPVK